MNSKKIITRIDQLLEQSQAVLNTTKRSEYSSPYVDSGAMAGLRSACLSFIKMIYGTDHPHYEEFNDVTNQTYQSNAQRARAVLLAIKSEIDDGWIFTIKSIISADIFSDFLEMADHLLDQGYKDAAAVMIGSVLEENLRQLCESNKVDTKIEKENGDLVPKKADRINADLCKQGVYTKLDQKSVAMWLALRNNAAHGKYGEYTKEQVSLMSQGVTDFLARMNS